MKRIFALASVGSLMVLLLSLGCASAPAEVSAPAAPQQAAAPVAQQAPAAPAPMAPAAPAAPAPAAPAAPAATPIPAPAFVSPIKPAPAAGRRIVTQMQEDEGTAVQGGTLRWVNQASIGNLDPVRNTSFVTHSVVQHWYDVPITWDGSLQPAVQMVDSWSVEPDATSYTFTLRDGLLFHDGSAVASDDVIASMQRWKNYVGVPSRIWELAEPELERVDEQTFKVNPTKPFGLWVEYWAQSPTFVMPAEVVEPLSEEEIMTDYTGSGPFKFSEWRPGTKVVMERFDDYASRSEPKSGGAGERIAYVDRVDVLEVPDAATRVASLLTQQVEFAEGLPNDFYDTLNDAPNLRVDVIPSWAVPALATNKLWPPLNNPKARLALQAATDPSKYMAAGYGDEDLWDLCGALFFCGTTWATEKHSENYYAEPNMEEAQRLWDEAVEESGFEGKMVLLTNTDYSDFYAAALVTREILESLGAEVDFVVTDWATVISRKIANLNKDPQTEQGWHFYHTWFGPLDPIQDPSLGRAWNGGWGNEAGMTLVEDFAKATSREEAMGIVEEIQRIYWEEDPSLIRYGTFSFLVTRQDYVKGYEPFRRILVDGVWLDK